MYNLTEEQVFALRKFGSDYDLNSTVDTFIKANTPQPAEDGVVYEVIITAESFLHKEYMIWNGVNGEFLTALHESISDILTYLYGEVVDEDGFKIISYKKVNV